MLVYAFTFIPVSRSGEDALKEYIQFLRRNVRILKLRYSISSHINLSVDLHRFKAMLFNGN